LNIKAWLSAFRLRTLPLALAGIAMGAFLAARKGELYLPVLVLSIITATLLQILSNLANDYGDSVNGADFSENGRKGPARMVQSGQISLQSMKNAMIICGVLAFISGIGLLIVSFASINLQFLIFIVLGLLSIYAAIKYTAGSNPYGYAGLGDIAVLLFFGFIGVGGSYFLHTTTFDLLVLLPAYAVGAFATAVLNVNNVRDIESDTKAGKMSIPVRIGRKAACYYHLFLVLSGLVAAAIYVIISKAPITSWVFLVASPVMLLNVKAVFQKTDSQALDPHLKQMALATLLFVVCLGVGINL